jgi:hypothetical protein
MHDELAREIEIKLTEMDTTLGNGSARDRQANLIAQKLSWLAARQKSRTNDNLQKS